MLLIRANCYRAAVSLWLCLLVVYATAQNARPYHLNGSAYQENCNCYTLTPDDFFLSGSVWNINKINLNEPFDFTFTVFLGCHDGDGADGIAFVLQPISTSVGATGGGIGYDGVSPSIGVLVDTWQNIEDNDPAFDHIAIHKNGIIDHSTMTDVTTPVPALPGAPNIEDCQWHVLRITWNPSNYRLNVEFDGLFVTGVTYDMVSEVFGGDPLVYWGFTGATGGSKNHQRVCTSLDPKFVFPAGQETCFPETLHFIDSSISFGSIDKWFWDFGDGTRWETSTPGNPPPHNYAAPGEYQASLQILGNDGCLSEPFVQTIVMGTEPEPGFSYSPYPVCEGEPTVFRDTSYVQFGTINQWTWNIGAQEYTVEEPPPIPLSGTTPVSLQVKTKEGCLSQVVSENLTSYPAPQIDFAAGNICITEASAFHGLNTRAEVDVSRWSWSFGDGTTRLSLSPDVNYRYRKGGVYDVQVTGYSHAGCASLPVSKQITVYETNAFAGNDTIVAVNQAIQLNGSGGEFYKWTPSDVLSADDIPNPVATLPRNTSLVLTAYTEAGCATTDTLNIKVYKGPSLYVPSAFSPNNDGHNDDFRFIAVGMSKIELFQVYNRYGQVMYSSTEIMKGWDGRLAGIPQPSGTYVWMIRGVDINGTIHSKKGTVTLVR